MAINQDDFITPITGNVVIQNNGARLVLQANADLNTLFEGDESFKLLLRKGSPTGPVVATTSVITVKDTSNTITYDSLVESADAVAEGGTVSITLDTTNLGPNNTLYYTITGNAESSLFAAGNTGSFITTGNAYTLEIATTATVPTNETRFFQIEVREDSVSGPVKITSNVISIVDSLQAFVSATGGSILIEDNYKIHTFTSSGELNISGLGIPAYRSIDYLVVAGGGGGGVGGGGAGGLRVGNISSTGTFTVSVGAGGVQGTNPNAPGTLRFGYRGGNSSISTIFECVGGGGSGGYFNSPEINGGSGGGTGYGHPAGTGIAGQGNNGGGFWNPSTGTNRGGGGGGAGSAGSTQAPWPVNGSGIGNAIGGGGIELSFYPSVANARYSQGGWYVENWATPSASTLPAGTNNGYGGNTYCRGAPGVVIIKYPYTVKTFDLTDNLTVPGAMIQGTNVIFSLRTTNTPNNSVLYYTTSGNVTTSDFFGGNTGSFTVVRSNATFSISIANNIVSGGDTKEFTLQLREGSITGPVVSSANTITIYSQDPSNFIQATGGTIIDSDGYRLHVFTTAGELDVSSTGPGAFNRVEYLIVAGGGGGTGADGPEQGGAGGGAGGLLTGITTVNVQPYVANIGGGGKGGAGNFPNPIGSIIGTSGSNSSIFGFVSVGGGHGGSGPGGSGGGGVEIMASPSLVTPPGGIGVTGQGFPGGRVTSATNPGGNTSAGGGAGAAGKGFGNGPLAGGIGKPVSWIPNSYGAGGPAPGRWFAGGGAGGNINPAGPVQGALGGAGGGGASAGPEGWPLGGPSALGQSGNVNTGGGGAGGTYIPGRGPTNPHGGGGGSGIIVIRYIKP